MNTLMKQWNVFIEEFSGVFIVLTLLGTIFLVVCGCDNNATERNELAAYKRKTGLDIGNKVRSPELINIFGRPHYDRGIIIDLNYRAYIGQPRGIYSTITWESGITTEELVDDSYLTAEQYKLNAIWALDDVLEHCDIDEQKIVWAYAMEKEAKAETLAVKGD